MKNLIFMAVLTEDQVSPKSAGGIWLPTFSGKTKSLRLFGVALSWGRGLPMRDEQTGKAMRDENDEIIYRRPPVQFGDLFELSRWRSICWWKRPLLSIFDMYGDSEVLTFSHPSAPGVSYTMTARHQACLVEPRHPICRLAHGRFLLRGEGPGPAPYPIADRVIVRHRPRELYSRLGVALPDWKKGWPSPVVQVQFAGDEATRVQPGDWALIPHNIGTSFKDPAGFDYSVIHESDIHLRFDEDPGEIEWVPNVDKQAYWAQRAADDEAGVLEQNADRAQWTLAGGVNKWV